MSYKEFSAVQDALGNGSPSDKPNAEATQSAAQPDRIPAKSAPGPDVPAANQPPTQLGVKPAGVAPAPKS